jgi:hypothetical protein
MTPDQKIQIWTAALTSLPTIVFTGVVAFWNWKRAQERVIVQIAPQYLSYPSESQRSLCAVGISVKNLSLFPIRISALAFVRNDKEIFRFYPENHRNDWPQELAVHSMMVIFTNQVEFQVLSNIGALETLILDGKTNAVALTATGVSFYSNRLSVRVRRRFKRLKERLGRKKSKVSEHDSAEKVNV